MPPKRKKKAQSARTTKKQKKSHAPPEVPTNTEAILAQFDEWEVFAKAVQAMLRQAAKKREDAEIAEEAKEIGTETDEQHEKRASCEASWVKRRIDDKDRLDHECGANMTCRYADEPREDLNTYEAYRLKGTGLVLCQHCFARLVINGDTCY